MAPDPRDQKWYSIAEQASKETDSAKLMILVDQLCRALDERINPLVLDTSLLICQSNPPAISMAD